MTYVSAIYEYNLSVRPDYDRDVARKKANAIFYKFNNQHVAARRMIVSAYDKVEDGSDTLIDPSFPQNQTIFAASKDVCNLDSKCKNDKLEKFTLFFKDVSSGEYVPFYMFEKTNRGMLDEINEYGESGNWYNISIMQSSQSLYGYEEMATKIVCITDYLYADDVELCVNEAGKHVDDQGHLQGTCCKEGKRYIVSYKSVDPRWLNRVNNGIAIDFWRAIEDIKYSSNLGIIQWDDAKDEWVFHGKTSMVAAYYELKKAWDEKELEKELENSSYEAKDLPRFMTYVTTWALPKNIFGEEFFKSFNNIELCKNTGCIFRINEF